MWVVCIVDMSSFVVPVDPATLEIVLKPMQIRTFQVTLKKWHVLHAGYSWYYLKDMQYANPYNHVPVIL